MSTMFQRIVVGVDEREGGRDALTLGARLIAPEGSLILCRVQVGDPLWQTTSATEDQERARQQLLAAAESADVPAQICVIESPTPGRGLHELAEEEDADLLVVGSTRRSLLGRVLVGDHTNAALNGAVCAVAVASAGYAGTPAD